MSRIKEVNGIKVLRRYSAGSIFSGLLCLAACAIPLLLLFLPWITFVGTDTIKMSVLDVIKCITNAGISGDPYEAAFEELSILGMISKYALIGFWSIICVMDLILLFMGLEFLFRGKVGHYKLPIVIFWFSFISMLILMVLAVVCQVTIEMKDVSGYKCSVYPNYIYAGVSLVILILLSVIYVSAFKNRVFIGDLGDLKSFTGDAELDEKGHIKYETKEIVKVRYEPAIGLPSSLTSIGGHAFSQNQNLVVAMVPQGIKTLGQGAFSNCGRLKIVSLPTSVKSIGFNCFWNCKSLTRINYAGTKEQWRHVKRGSNWLAKAGTYTVICVDGSIVVNPYH